MKEAIIFAYGEMGEGILKLDDPFGYPLGRNPGHPSYAERDAQVDATILKVKARFGFPLCNTRFIPEDEVNDENACAVWIVKEALRHLEGYFLRFPEYRETVLRWLGSFDLSRSRSMTINGHISGPEIAIKRNFENRKKRTRADEKFEGVELLPKIAENPLILAQVQYRPFTAKQLRVMEDIDVLQFIDADRAADLGNRIADLLSYRSFKTKRARFEFAERVVWDILFKATGQRK